MVDLGIPILLWLNWDSINSPWRKSVKQWFKWLCVSLITDSCVNLGITEDDIADVKHRWRHEQCEMSLYYICEKDACAAEDFRCWDGSTCVNNRWLCDGLSDCGDGSDEDNCDGHSLTHLHRPVFSSWHVRSRKTTCKWVWILYTRIFKNNRIVL